MDQAKQITVGRLVNEFLRGNTDAQTFINDQAQVGTDDAVSAVSLVQCVLDYSVTSKPSQERQARAVRSLIQQRRAKSLEKLRLKAIGTPFIDVVQFARDLVGAKLVLLNRSDKVNGGENQHVAVRNRDAHNLRLWDHQARDAATSLLDELGEYTIPLDLRKVADYLGIYVQEVALTDRDGCIFRSEDLAAILLNSNVKNISRKRFTLAHEIGHGVLHADESAFVDNNINTPNYQDVQERQANVFASYLLAPLSEMKPFLNVPPTVAQAQSVTKRFDLSFAAALIRLVRDSNWDCALVASHEGKVQWAFSSEHFPGFIPGGISLPVASVARLLHERSIPGPRTGKVPPGSWLSNEWLHEESYRIETGWIYTILVSNDE